RRKMPFNTHATTLTNVANGSVVRFGGEDYEVVDVPGDGNCLFHSLLVPGVLPTPRHVDLRRRVVEMTMSPLWIPVVRDVLTMFYRPNFDVDTYRARLGRVGSWVGDCEMCLVAILFGVNITSFACVKDPNNVNKAVSVFSTATTLSSMNRPWASHASTELFVHFHQYGRPCTNQQWVSLNHFCALVPKFVQSNKTAKSEDRLDALNPPTATPSATTTKSKNRLEAWNPVDVMLTGIAGAMSSTASTAPAIRSAETTKASTKPAPKRAFTQLTLSSLPMWNKKPTSVKRTKTTQQKDVKKVPADVQVKTDIMMRYIGSLQAPENFVSKILRGREDAMRAEASRIKHLEHLDALEVGTVVSGVLEELVATIEATEVRLPGVKLQANSSELTWSRRAIVIGYYLHPHLGDGCMPSTLKLFGNFAKEGMVLIHTIVYNRVAHKLSRYNPRLVQTCPTHEVVQHCERAHAKAHSVVDTRCNTM
ncbi:hypothetical protein DYB35_013103, partial [Aphanomyces astaci]